MNVAGLPDTQASPVLASGDTGASRKAERDDDDFAQVMADDPAMAAVSPLPAPVVTGMQPAGVAISANGAALAEGTTPNARVGVGASAVPAPSGARPDSAAPRAGAGTAADAVALAAAEGSPLADTAPPMASPAGGSSAEAMVTARAVPEALAPPVAADGTNTPPLADAAGGGDPARPDGQEGGGAGDGDGAAADPKEGVPPTSAGAEGVAPADAAGPAGQRDEAPPAAARAAPPAMQHAPHPSALPQGAPTSAQIAPQLAEAIRLLPDGPVEIALSPEELGSVRMTMTQDGARLLVVVSAERPETQDLMRRNADDLARDLRDMGFEGVEVDVRQGSADRDRQPDGSFRTAVAPVDDLETWPVPGDTRAGPVSVAANAGGSLDLRL